MRDTAPPYITPPAIARRFGITHEKVMHWIKSGQLKAVNIATRPTGRPRYVVAETELQAFENRRASVPMTPIPRKRKETAHVGREWF